MRKLEIENVENRLEVIYRRVVARGAKLSEPSETEIDELVQKYRHGSLRYKRDGNIRVS